jgi:hypothetical protein
MPEKTAAALTAVVLREKESRQAVQAAAEAGNQATARRVPHRAARRGSSAPAHVGSAEA